MKLVVHFLIVFITASCLDKAGQSASDPVKVTTKGIYEPVSILVDGQRLKSSMDLGEFVKGGEAKKIELRIENNSGYPVYDISLNFLDLDVGNFDYAVNEEGSKEFPGGGGDCSSSGLSSGHSCVVMLEFSALSSGQITQTFRLRYKNIVEPGDKTFSMTLLAGTPASLIFVPDTLNYHFGNLTGSSQVPLVERNQPEVRSQNLTITNAGELTARNLIQTLSQNCSSKFDGSCPAPLMPAYELISYNCPQDLATGETCSARIEYENRNQGPDPAYKDVAFNSILKIAYERDPEGNLASLNGYFESVSANIEAFLEPSLNTIEFQDPLTSGNRDKQSFRIKNTGYREGFLRRLNIYDDGQTQRLFYCQKGSDAVLDCYDDGGAPVGLNKLPIFFVDLQSCMNSAMNKALMNDDSCIFELYFQPSLDFASSGSFNYDIKFEYDTRFLGQETIVESSAVDINVSGSWKSPAKLVWKDIKVGNGSRQEFINSVKVAGLGSTKALNSGDYYTLGGPSSDIPLVHQNFINACEPRTDFDGNELGTPVEFSNTASGTITGKIFENRNGLGKGILIESGGSVQDGSQLSFKECESVNWADLGRLAMELWEFYDRESVQFRFINIGGSDATNIRLFDGAGSEVIPGTPKSLGFSANNCSSADSGSCPFYENVSYSCPTLAPSNEVTQVPCVVSFGFSPIKREADTVADSHQSMFDYQGATLFENYKSLKLTYDNGARFSDSNLLSDTPDLATPEVEARLHGVLVNKGLLSEMQVVTPPGNAVFGEYSFQTVMLRNIGTGPIPYIYDNGIPFDKNLSRSATAGLPPGELDCDDVIDWDGDGSHTGSLASGEACYLTLRAQATNADRSDPNVLYGASFIEIQRLFNSTIDPDYLWEVRKQGFQVSDNLLLSYYDGDVSNPDKTGAYSEDHGQLFTINEELEMFSFNPPPHIIPLSPLPEESAVMARQGFVKNDLYHNTNLIFSSESLERHWFYSDLNLDMSESEASPTAYRSPADTYDALFSFRSIDRARSVLPSACGDCDYAIHFGTLRADRGAKSIGFTLANTGASTGKVAILSLTDNASGKFSLDPASQLSNATFYQGSGQQIELVFTPSPGDSGVYSAVVEYQVDSGISADKVTAPNEIWTYRIELVVEVLSLYPDLSFEYMNYDVVTDDPNPPTETLDTSESHSLLSSYGLEMIPSPATNSAMLEMVKLEDPGPGAGYVKKRLVVKRENADVSNIQVVLKAAANEKTVSPIDVFTGVDVDNFCQGATLTVGSPECYVDIKYQPTEASITQSMVLGFAYEIQNGQMVMQNVQFSLIPKTPGVLYPQNPLYQETYGGLDAVNDAEAMALDFTQAIYDQPNKEIRFNNVTILNDSAELRASFLKSWQMQNGHSDVNVYPSAGDWSPSGGENYLVIYQTLYADSTPRITVKANEACIYGEYPPSDPDFALQSDDDRGFLGGGFADCHLNIVLRLNANYINQNLGNREPLEVMGDNYFKLHYYSFTRVETSYLSFYFKGMVKPDPYYKNGDFYDVFAFDDKTLEFAFDDVSLNNSTVGGLAGFRVYYAESQAALNNVLRDGGDYLTGDYAALGSNRIVVDGSNLTGIARKKAYYFKVMAIRSNPDYTAGGFDGLSSGLYLSDGNLPVLRVVVPEFNYHYFHGLQTMVKKDVERSSETPVGPMDQSSALSVCSGLPKITINDASSGQGPRAVKLINPSIWEALRLDPSASVYSGGEDWLTLPHWLDSAAYDIHTVFSGRPGYLAGASNQRFDADFKYYFRCSDGCLNDRLMGGGFLGEDFRDYYSYVGETVPLGYARCFVSTAR